jgi:NADH:ubiquinone oxidoreductase subunit 3 (subunit A)
VVLSHEAEGERAYQDWSAILHLVDILCCCAVLIPIVWQVNALEKSLEGASDENGSPPSTLEERRMLSKLKLFRSFYLTVVAYIYFTRILIYLFATMLDYRHTWIRYFVAELATLLFYVVTGLRFQPMKENPYLSTDESMKPMIEPEHEIEFGRIHE